MLKRLCTNRLERSLVTHKSWVTPLMFATQYGFSEGISELMKEDTLLYKRDSEARTALSYMALDHKNKIANDVAFKLIWKLIKVDQKAISYCIEERNVKYFNLMKTQCSQNHIHAALRYNFPSAIDYYLKENAD